MIKSNNYDELVYDVESQVAALEVISNYIYSVVPGLVLLDEQGIHDAEREIERLKYFVRQYCTHDEFSGLDKLRKKHSLLVDKVEAFDGLPWGGRKK